MWLILWMSYFYFTILPCRVFKRPKKITDVIILSALCVDKQRSSLRKNYYRHISYVFGQINELAAWTLLRTVYYNCECQNCTASSSTRMLYNCCLLTFKLHEFSVMTGAFLECKSAIVLLYYYTRRNNCHVCHELNDS